MTERVFCKQATLPGYNIYFYCRVEFGPFCDSETEDCERAGEDYKELNFTSYKPAELLEAVYCDPCKTKVTDHCDP